MGRRQRRRAREQAGQRALSAAPAAAKTEAAAAGRVGVPPSGLEGLSQLVAQQRALVVAIDAQVDRLVAAGVGWPVIASALGVSRQAVRQRFARRQGTSGT